MINGQEQAKRCGPRNSLNFKPLVFRKREREISGPSTSLGTMARSLTASAWAVLVLALGTGCVQTRITEPPRSGVEQLLLSTAADRSLRQAASLEIFKDKKTFVDGTYFDSYDKLYVLGSIRQILSESGALLVAEMKEAEIVVEPRSGALSTDSGSSLIGMPSIPMPIPLAGTFQTPELYLMKSQRLDSVAKLALFAIDQKSRQHVYSSGVMVGKARHRYYSFIGFIKITRTDIPEKK